MPGDNKWLDAVEDFRPQTLAGSLRQLLFLASMRESVRPKLAALRHSIVVIFQTEQTWLSADDREELWSAFGLPVYEQIYCASGLLATECEAHDGLHVAKGSEWTVGQAGELWCHEPTAWWEERGESFAPSGLFGAVDSLPCACGRKTPRLRIVGPAEADLLQHPAELAASAGTLAVVA